MQLRRASSLVVVAVIASFAPPVHAACSAKAAAADYAEARKAFVEKRFDDSIALLREAYACDANPIYLGNVARAYEESNRPSEAVVAWREYLATLTDAHERVQVEGRISTLTKLIDDLDRAEKAKKDADEARRKAEADAATAKKAPAATPPPSNESHVSAGAWIVGSIGVAAIVTGGYFGLKANARHDSAVSENDVARADSLQSDARTFARDANVSFVIGGLALAASFAWIAIDLSSPPAPSTSASPPAVSLSVSFGAIGLSGAF